MTFLTESKLVNDFKASYSVDTNSIDDQLILDEVNTNWGIVDILVILFNSQRRKQRRKEINKKKIDYFTNIDSYALTHIIRNPYITIKDLNLYLKIKNGLLNNTINKLLNRGLIYIYNNDKIRAKAIRKIYIIKEIIAYEAKLTDWQKALCQAERHLWFTNSSFVILSNLSNTVIQKVRKSCTEKGLGLIIKNKENYFQILNKPLYKKHIDSILSWKINEALVDGIKFNGTNTIR